MSEGGGWGYWIGELVVNVLRCTHIYSGGVGRVGEVGQMDNLYLLDIAKMPPINHCDYMYRIHNTWPRIYARDEFTGLHPVNS